MRARALRGQTIASAIAAAMGVAVGCGGGPTKGATGGEIAAASADRSGEASAASGPSARVDASVASAAVREDAASPDDGETGGAVLIGAIIGTRQFDPRAVLEGRKRAWLDCYHRARVNHPALHGKLRLDVKVDEGGKVVSVRAEPGGGANDAGLVACLGDDLKQNTHFPRPGGSATVIAPLVFQR